MLSVCSACEKESEYCANGGDGTYATTVHSPLSDALSSQ